MSEIKELKGVLARMANLLSDGIIHTLEELQGCLNEPDQSRAAIRRQVVNLRKLLNPKGLDVLYVVGSEWKRGYRMVRLLKHPSE